VARKRVKTTEEKLAIAIAELERIVRVAGDHGQSWPYRVGAMRSVAAHALARLGRPQALILLAEQQKFLFAEFLTPPASEDQP